MSTTPDTEEPAPAAASSAGGTAPLLRWLTRAASLGALRREAKATARNAGIRVMLTVTAGLLWLLVLGFLLGAFVVWLAGVVGGIAACAMVAAFFAVVALILHAVSARMARRKHRWQLETQFPGLSKAVGNTSLDEKTLGALVVAALAGFFIGLRGRH